jgi:hypothetical protein
MSTTTTPASVGTTIYTKNDPLNTQFTAPSKVQVDFSSSATPNFSSAVIFQTGIFELLDVCLRLLHLGLVYFFFFVLFCFVLLSPYFFFLSIFLFFFILPVFLEMIQAFYLIGQNRGIPPIAVMNERLFPS